MKPCHTILLVGVLAAIAAGGCDLGLPPEVARLAYANRSLRFAMDLPEGWTWRESTGTAALIATGPAQGPGDRPSVTVVVGTTYPSTTLGAFVGISRGRLERLPQYHAVADEPRALANGHQAQVATFEHAAVSKPVRQRQLYVVAGGHSYVVTATASPPDTFDRYETDFETVFRSFRAAW